MHINEFHRRMAIVNRRAMELCARYSAATDAAVKAAINIAIGEELNAAPSIRDVTRR